MRRGLILIVVLVAVVFLSLGAYTFTDMMVAHHQSAELSGRQLQTRMLLDSGVDAVRLFLALGADGIRDGGGMFDNAERFKNLNVIFSDEPEERGSVTILAPNIDDEGNLSGVRYGLEDESTRLNLNALVKLDQMQPGTGRSLLMALPSMTEDVADAILDWADADSDPREMGAEADYYSGLSRPYGPKNGPFDTVEELLLVKGVTPQLLFGQDSNRNGRIDPAEATTDNSNPAANDPALARGWQAYLTLYSMEKNLNPQGRPRINLNMANMELLHSQLLSVFPPEWATFIVAYRQNGPSTVAVNGMEVAETRTPDLTKPGKVPLVQVLDLIGATTQAQFPGDTSAKQIKSPFPSEVVAMGVYLPTLLDHVTINPATTIPGRININQASATILRGIPGMDADLVDLIISRRKRSGEDEDGSRRHETWLLTTGVCELDKMRAIAPFVNCGGSVFRGQVVGYFQGGTAASRAEVVWETTSPLPRVLFWRDISHLGRGYALETLGVDYSETPQ